MAIDSPPPKARVTDLENMGFAGQSRHSIRVFKNARISSIYLYSFHVNVHTDFADPFIQSNDWGPQRSLWTFSLCCMTTLNRC